MTSKELYEQHLAKAANGTALRERMLLVGMGGASATDLIEYAKWELWEAIYSLPPEAPNSRPADPNHAGCCALRADSAIRQLERLLASGADKTPDRKVTP